MKTATITMRIEEPLKERAKAIFEKMGLSTSQAIALFLNRVVAEEQIPFTVCVPNAETVQALEDDEKDIGLKRVSNAQALLELLNK